MKYKKKDAIELDNSETFHCLDHLFELPKDENGLRITYLNGNSLGPMPKNVTQALMQECADWGNLGVRGHFDKKFPWVSYHELVTQSLARLVGATDNEVVATGTLTTNMHSTFVSFYRPTQERFKIICLSGFSSDAYAINSQIKQRLETMREFVHSIPFCLENAVIEITPDETGYISMDVFRNIIHEHGKSTALIWLEAIHFLTGQYFNIQEIAKLAKEYGCKLGLDLAHAIGNVPLELHKWDVDFAVWCSYKYLSGGPGAIGGLYINEKHHSDPNMLYFAGWWGHNKDTRFQLLPKFDPIPTAESWQTSNPGIFLLASLRTSLVIFDQVDLFQLREKNKRLTSYLEYLLLENFSDAVQIITPRKINERGCQLTLRMVNKFQGIEIEKKLYEHGVICDSRGDLVRVAPMGLYNTYVDVFNFVEKLELILRD